MCRSLCHPTHHKPKDDLLDHEEKALYDHILCEYRTALAEAQFSLARANAQSAQKDQRITALTEQMAKLRAPKPGPH